MRLDRILAPAIEPLTLAEVKLHVRVETDVDDALLSAEIATARDWVEQFLSRALINSTWDFYLDGWPRRGRIKLPLAPASVVSVHYQPFSDDVETELEESRYKVSAPIGPYAGATRIVRSYQAYWPWTRPEPDVVRVRFQAGYGDAAADVPETIRQGMLLFVGEMYSYREATVTGTIASKLPWSVEKILNPYRFIAWGD